jgi:polyisoprenoid-binding protein YceI
MMLRKVVFAAVAVAGLGLATAREAMAGGTYSVDTVHSTVLFRVKHMNASFAYGRFNDISGQFAFDDQDPAQSRFEFVVKADSIDTASPQRDQHLKSPDFLNAVQYPTITFKSKTVAKDGPDAFQVTGDLTFHGVTKPISFKLTRTGSGKDFKGKAIAGFEAPFWIKRSEFKMSPKMIGPVGDDVLVTVSVEGVQ